MRSRLPVRLLTAFDRVLRPADHAGLSASRLVPLALVGAAACWGAGTVVSKQAVAELPPLTLLAVQLGVSVVFLLGLSVARGQHSPAGREGRLLGRLGLLNPGLAYALSLIGLTQVSASLSVLLWATEPVLILLLAAAILRERVGIAFLAATAVAIVGLLLVVFDPAANGAATGVLLTMAGVGVCAIYTVTVRRWLPGTTDSTLGVVLAQQVHALALSIVVVVVLATAGQPVWPNQLTAVGLSSAIASGLLYYALAYLLYLSALRSITASVAAASFYLVPVFGVAFASIVGEHLQPEQWLGGVLVVGAVAVATMLPGRTSAPRPAYPSSAESSAQIASAPNASSRR